MSNARALLRVLAPALAAAAALAQPAAAQEKVKISIGHIGHSSIYQVQNTVGLLAKDLEATGKAEVTLYGTGSAYSIPGKFSELVEKGVLDMALGALQYEPGRYPGNLLAGEPLLVDDHVGGSRAYMKTFSAFPELQAEFKPNRVIVVGMVGAEQFHSRKPLRSIDDLKGMRVLVTNPGIIAMVREVGGTVAVLPAPTQYEQLQKGVVDAVSAQWASLVIFKTAEVTTHHLALDSVASPFFIVMNQKKYEASPPEIRKVIDDYSTVETVARFSSAWHHIDGRAQDEAKSRGNVIVRVDAAQREALRKRFAHLTEARLADLEKKGFPARKVHAALVAAVAAEAQRQ